MQIFSKTAATSIVLALLAVPASAVPVYGGSDLLDAGDASRLESWLGQGSISLSNIFTKQEGDFARDFHAAVDGRGDTITLIEVTGNSYGAFDAPIVIGGYNPLSWGLSGYHYSSYGSRDAFIFNLDSDRRAGQFQGGSRGRYQTLNHIHYGPTFGAGHDIFVGTSLDHGYAYSYSYATYSGSYWSNGWHTSILGAYSVNLAIGAIEVFSVDAAPVSEPATLVLLAVGILGLAVTGRRSASR